MQRLQTDLRRHLLPTSALLAFVVLSASPVDAGKPAPDPEPDILIDFNFVWFAASGAINEIGDVDVVDNWTDEDGVRWLQLRYHHGEEDPYFFETILPSNPKRNWEYPFQLIAGPSGYLSGGVLYVGPFAAGTATGITRDRWVWDGYYDAISGEWIRHKHKVREVYWDPLEAYLLP